MFLSFLRYVAAALFVLVLLFFVFAQVPAPRPTNKNLADCAAHPSADCLTDLGVELAMNARSLPPYLRAVDHLARMGRIEQARALEFRIVLDKGSTLDVANVQADRKVARYRLAAALRQGMNLEEAISATPAVTVSTLWITARSILRRNGYFQQGLANPNAMPPDDLANLVGIMAKIDEMSENLPDHAKPSSKIYAAEIAAALHDRARAIRLLEQVPRSDTRPPPHFSKELMRAVGVTKALDIYRDLGGSMHRMLYTAARAETDPARAVEFILQAFEGHETEEPWPDFQAMKRLVFLGIDIGQPDLALTLARRMAQNAESTEFPFQYAANIDAAQALAAAAAPDDEIRDSIAFAENLFPEEDSEVVGFGLVGGLYRWEEFKAEAHGDIAKLSAHLGDLKKARRMIDAIEPEDKAWRYILSRDVPVADLDALLRAAQKALPADTYALVLSGLAAQMVLFGASEEQEDWAHDAVFSILQQEQLKGDVAFRIYLSAVLVAEHSRNEDLKQLAINRFASAALASRDYSNLIRAGLTWHNFHANQL